MSITAFNACVDAWRRRGVRLGELPESVLIPQPAADVAAHESFVAFLRAAKATAARKHA